MSTCSERKGILPQAVTNERTNYAPYSTVHRRTTSPPHRRAASPPHCDAASPSHRVNDRKVQHCVSNAPTCAPPNLRVNSYPPHTLNFTSYSSIPSIYPVLPNTFNFTSPIVTIVWRTSLPGHEACSGLSRVGPRHPFSAKTTAKVSRSCSVARARSLVLGRLSWSLGRSVGHCLAIDLVRFAFTPY